jgi:type III restriction enzyme
MLTHVMHEKGMSLTSLVRARFQFAQAIEAEIERLRLIAMNTGFQKQLPCMEVAKAEDIGNYSFRFESGKYPARNIYDGGFDFKKHFFSMIHDLREKTPAGKESEEFRCAMAIETHPKVKRWVRNIERQPLCSFWLPTSTDYFYPDFIVELVDGRTMAVEYKGEPYKTNDDSKEKLQVGHQWEKACAGRSLFLFAVKSDDQGRDVFKQLADKLS